MPQIREEENKTKLPLKLEKENANLREGLLRNVKFSTELSKITYEMDRLLGIKGKEIRNLENKLKESQARISLVETGVMDFDIDMADMEAIQLKTIEVDLKSEDLNVNDYVKTYDLESKKLSSFTP